MYSLKTDFIDQEYFAQLINQLGFLLNDGVQFAIDSRKVNPHTVFCAYPGTLTDGRQFIPAAIAAGAKGILWEEGDFPPPAITNYPVKNLMHYVGLLAARQAKYPSQSMRCLAVTGTNGKTSVTHWLNQAYNFLGQTAAIVGTTGAGIYPAISDYASTTPDPITLQDLLAKFSAQQVAVLAMEVSSHALSQGRVNGVNFSTAIFTNLTQDHLDYHKTMANYAAAKELLFFWDGLQHAVINSDDAYGVQLISTLRRENPQLKLLSYGLESGDLRARQIKLTTRGVEFELDFAGQTVQIYSPVVGRFNVYNLLAVFAALLVNDTPFEALPAIAASLKPVCGRMDAAILPNKPLVVVDYSHTPDALEKALSTLNELKGSGKLICVFGCGGNRDRGKRPLMGGIATALADHCIITSDNPRFEDPETIIQEICAGLMAKNYQIIVDRHTAIMTAIQIASSNDVVLIAGKGHENYQEINGIKHHFSDLEIVGELLNA